MNLLQLDHILTKICIVLLQNTNVFTTFEISSSEKEVYAALFFNGDYKPIHSIKMPKSNNYTHIYWSLAYHAIQEGNLEILEAEEIYNQFKLHKKQHNG